MQCAGMCWTWLHTFFIFLPTVFPGLAHTNHSMKRSKHWPCSRSQQKVSTHIPPTPPPTAFSLSAVICQWLSKMSERSTWRAPGRWRGAQTSWQQGCSGGSHKMPGGNWTEVQKKNIYIYTTILVFVWRWRVKVKGLSNTICCRLGNK